MSEADALLDAIWANPADDTPRLVYADWLQENGYEDYAQFIRLSLFITRQVLPPDDRTALRRLRYLLGQDIVKTNPQASRLVEACNPPDGIPQQSIAIDAGSFLENCRNWWPYISPRQLVLWNLCDREVEVSQCEYLRRVAILECEGSVISGLGHWREEADWRPVAGVLLSELANNTNLQRIRALKVEPIQATDTDLLGFAVSRLASHLEDLRLWVQFPDGTREDLRAENGLVQEQIADFVAEHAARFASLTD